MPMRRRRRNSSLFGLQQIALVLVGMSLSASPDVVVGGYQFRSPVRGASKARIDTVINPLHSSSSAVSPVVEDFVSDGAQATGGGVLSVEVDPLDGGQEIVPTNMQEAIHTFLFSGDFGPLMVVASIIILMNTRIQMSSLGMVDLIVFALTVVFWSVQEHFLHEKVLHSEMDWIGKEIHQGHHEKPFYHISIEPAPLLLGWMLAAHLMLRLLLPLPLALTATVAYSLSGIFYEWAHFIVHTKVRFRSHFWRRVKENHVRHHMVSDQYWFAFSMPFMDDIFDTNPPVREVKRQIKQKKHQERNRVSTT